MKLKIASALLITLSFLLPTAAFAESNSLIHDYSDNFSIESNVSNYGNVIDKDLTTRAVLDLNVSTRKYIKFNFNMPVNIDRTFAKWSNSPNDYVYIVTYGNTDSDSYVMTQVFENGLHKDVDFKNVKSLEIQSNNGNGKFLYLFEVDLYGEVTDGILPGQPGDKTPPSEVANVEVETTENSATIKYNHPSDVDFSHVNVYFDGKTYESSTGQVTIPGLKPETSYSAVVKTVDTLGNESEGIPIDFKTAEEVIEPPSKPEEVPEVQNLQIETDGERVDLSWKNPPKYFDKAKIYRKDLGSNETAFNWNPFAPMKVSANADFKPLFETNGTEFSDLSIEPETEYEYKVTANYNGMESKGVTVLASVPKPPLINTDDVKLPFGIGELIKSGNGLLGLIGGFVLLALAFIFVPKVIAAIRGANTGNSRGAPGAPGRAERIGKQPNVTDRQMNLATGNGRQERAGRQPRLRDRQVKGV